MHLCVHHPFHISLHTHLHQCTVVTFLPKHLSTNTPPFVYILAYSRQAPKVQTSFGPIPLQPEGFWGSAYLRHHRVYVSRYAPLRTLQRTRVPNFKINANGVDLGTGLIPLQIRCFSTLRWRDEELQFTIIIALQRWSYYSERQPSAARLGGLFCIVPSSACATTGMYGAV